MRGGVSLFKIKIVSLDDFAYDKLEELRNRLLKYAESIGPVEYHKLSNLGSAGSHGTIIFYKHSDALKFVHGMQRIKDLKTAHDFLNDEGYDHNLVHLEIHNNYKLNDFINYIEEKHGKVLNIVQIHTSSYNIAFDDKRIAKSIIDSKY